ncbi:tRNA pseudouridine(55) synthase TruB [Candidatus Uhrbacteria bacterium CG10_big_fil_rev_8_21_14_0_10_48_16]|uniref:tRNA pseudouridine synthase B n=1 Tax=Candidatus Uhrbacteria bacterium CG10_big_fil_rev_8_21_14_0_10_48_16 TaxID=1975038 RepID=A0A2M8LH51_9BACT|nr:MAG: tRNA pseudouridine(55) synthase TruB [Candidatus Uhrbacteria bacterium CG10_big_fil_rev_8_21_14_0_10_48_16]
MPKSQVINQETTQKEGFLLIDKPAGMTSHDVVNRVRRFTGERRVGHAGTLDPFATGLLIVGVGRGATREMQNLVGLDKRYEATFILGASSTTDDMEGEILATPLNPHLREEEIEDALKQFIGEIEQIPPTYSAIKIGGKKMYEAAREGKPLEAKPRNVTIYSIKPISAPTVQDHTVHIDLVIHCSTGTYIRAIARDLGKALGGGGYVEELRRTSIGPFTIDQAHALESLKEGVEEALVPVKDLLSPL